MKSSNVGKEAAVCRCAKSTQALGCMTDSNRLFLLWVILLTDSPINTKQDLKSGQLAANHLMQPTITLGPAQSACLPP